MARSLVVPAVMLAASLLCRSMAFVPAVIDTDVGLYMVQARAWLAGDWPIVAVWDMHPPGAPALIALAMVLFGEGVVAVRLLGVVMVALTGCALAALVRQGGGTAVQGLAVGLVYVAHTPLLTGLETNTEILLAPFVAGAMSLAVRTAAGVLDADKAPRMRDMAAIGLPIGCALVIKQLAVFEGCLAFAVAALPAWRRGVIDLRRLILLAAVYACMCAAPILLLALTYAVQGGLSALWDALVLAPLRYSSGRLSAVEALQAVSAAALVLALPLVLAVTGTIRPLAEHRRLIGLGWAWLGTAALGVAAPGMFFQHYFVMALPALGLLAGLGAWRAASALRPTAPVPLLAGMIALLALLAWREDAAPRIHAGFGLSRPDPPRAVAAALRAAVPAGSRVLVANYHPVVLVLAGMEPPSRFVFPAQLTGHFGAVLPVDADAEVTRILAARPAAIIVDRGWMHTMRAGAAAMIERALAAHYILAAEVAEQRGPVQIWRLRDPST
ncbi:glycosyltransferase family 39 protein [Elioraea sp.]|uniref:glycosyltransferase family 39 protein n=1 Tax=Elioraea sp. TaxID=2185103 RepID=UPI003F70843E